MLFTKNASKLLQKKREREKGRSLQSVWNNQKTKKQKLAYVFQK